MKIFYQQKIKNFQKFNFGNLKKWLKILKSYFLFSFCFLNFDDKESFFVDIDDESFCN